MSTRVIAFLLAALTAVVVAGGPLNAGATASRSRPLPPLPSPKSCSQVKASALAPAQEKAMLCLINRFRRQQGLSALVADPALRKAAKAKARAIVNCDDFSHEACGHPFTYWFQRAGYLTGSWAIGENLAWSGASSPTFVHSPRMTLRDWIHSPEHLENLLDPRWRDQGVAVVRGGFGGQAYASVWVSQFGAH